MNEGIIILGSNQNPEENLEKAIERINEKYEVIDKSKVLITLPRTKKYKNHFLNQAIKILSDEYYEDSVRFFKQIESELGRTPESKEQGLMPIDIDFVFGMEKRCVTIMINGILSGYVLIKSKDKPSISLL